jgi:hypothetical protein
LFQFSNSSYKPTAGIEASRHRQILPAENSYHIRPTENSHQVRSPKGIGPTRVDPYQNHPQRRNSAAQALDNQSTCSSSKHLNPHSTSKQESDVEGVCADHNFGSVEVTHPDIKPKNRRPPPSIKTVLSHPGRYRSPQDVSPGIEYFLSFIKLYY